MNGEFVCYYVLERFILAFRNPEEAVLIADGHVNT